MTSASLIDIDLDRAVELFGHGLIATEDGDRSVLAHVRAELADLVDRHGPEFPRQVIDAATVHLCTLLPRTSRSEIHGVIVGDLCRIAPRLKWIELDQIPPWGHA
jgi:hypothetical protein